MPFTEDELRAIREADAEIERIFEAEYFKSRKDHVEMDKMLDSEIVKDRKARNIAAYKKAYYEAKKRPRRSGNSRRGTKKIFMFSVTESEEMSR